MIRILMLLLATPTLAGCVAHKITLSDSAYEYRNHHKVVVTEKRGGIPHCGFAQITIITAGIIPNGCERTIVVTSSEVPDETEIGKVSYLQGWITLLLTPFPSWSYQDSDNFSKKIASEIRNDE